MTVHRLFEQLQETLDLPESMTTICYTGDLAGQMFEGFDNLSFERQYQVLRKTFRRPHVAPEVRMWMFRNGISPLDIYSLIRERGTTCLEIVDESRLIDFDHWANVNEKLRKQGLSLLSSSKRTRSYLIRCNASL